jgi:hypothetical protein
MSYYTYRDNYTYIHEYIHTYICTYTYRAFYWYIRADARLGACWEWRRRRSCEPGWFLFLWWVWWLSVPGTLWIRSLMAPVPAHASETTLFAPPNSILLPIPTESKSRARNLYTFQRMLGFGFEILYGGFWELWIAYRNIIMSVLWFFAFWIRCRHNSEHQ